MQIWVVIIAIVCLFCRNSKKSSARDKKVVVTSGHVSRIFSPASNATRAAFYVVVLCSFEAAARFQRHILVRSSGRSRKYVALKLLHDFVVGMQLHDWLISVCCCHRMTYCDLLIEVLFTYYFYSAKAVRPIPPRSKEKKKAASKKSRGYYYVAAIINEHLISFWPLPSIHVHTYLGSILG
jgi:hypothetical protein